MTLLTASADGERQLENMVTKYYPFFQQAFPNAESLANFGEITMGEGGTPLIAAGRAVRDYLEGFGISGLKVYFKAEWANPTGSMKDRGMAVAVAKAKEKGYDTLICASTGNTSAAAAAYGGRADMKVIVLISKDTPETKLAQAVLYGARIVKYGSFDEGMKAAEELAMSVKGVALVNSVNDDRIEGQKTASFEIADALGDAPDMLFIPVGNAGNITAYGRGFAEYLSAGKISKMPVMIGARATADTEAQAIKIREPRNKKAAYRIAAETGGAILEDVTDAEMRAAHAALRGEGLLTELASAISLAALPRYAGKHEIPKGSSAVMVLTGNGLKDAGITMKGLNAKVITVETRDELERAVYQMRRAALK